jgi:hypothetical protein
MLVSQTGEIVGAVGSVVELPVVDAVERLAVPWGAAGVHGHDVSIVIVGTGGESGRAIVGAGSLSRRLWAPNFSQDRGGLTATVI